MKIREFLNVCNSNEIEYDVYGNYTDEWEIAYVGDPEFNLTEEGRKMFDKIMDLEIEIGESKNAVVHISPLGNMSEDDVDMLVRMFFYACAGYIGNSFYEKWFVK